MKHDTCIFFLLLICCHLHAQDLIERKNSFRLGPEYSISSTPYMHSLGVSLLTNQRHLFGIGASLLPPNNDNPFRNPWNYGGYIDYCLVLGRPTQVLTPFINIIMQHISIKETFFHNYSNNNRRYDINDHWFYNMLGMGLNINTSRTIIKISTSMPTVFHNYTITEFNDYNSGQHYIETERRSFYNKIHGLSIENFAFKIAVAYYFRLGARQE